MKDFSKYVFSSTPLHTPWFFFSVENGAKCKPNVPPNRQQTKVKDVTLGFHSTEIIVEGLSEGLV